MSFQRCLTDGYRLDLYTMVSEVVKTSELSRKLQKKLGRQHRSGNCALNSTSRRKLIA